MTDLPRHAGADDGEVALAHDALDAFDRGARHYVEGNAEAAVEQFDYAIELEPAFGDALYLKGLALLRLGRSDEGAAALREAASVTGNAILRDYAERKLSALESGAGTGAE